MSTSLPISTRAKFAVQSAFHAARLTISGQSLDQFYAKRRRESATQTHQSITNGGLINYGTGLGTKLDKSDGFYQRGPLEILPIQSWAAKKFLEIVIKDMFIRWRSCVSEKEDIVERLAEQERILKGKEALRNAAIAGRQYGTGIVVPITSEADLKEPLDLDRIRPGTLKAFQYFDRYDISATGKEDNMMSPQYGEPIFYELHPDSGRSPVRVHASRVIRFDGLTPPTKSGFSYYDENFGESVLIPVINDILKSAQISGGIAHMVQEASIPVLHVEGIRENIAGQAPEDPSVETIGEQINMMKSIYRLLMLDAKSREELTRVNIQFAGLADILNQSWAGLAAAADIPETRFLGNPPTGMDATGESDMENYVIMMEAQRAEMFEEALWLYDQLMMRNLGLSEPLEYEWNSLIELSDQSRALLSKTKAEAVQTAVSSGAIDEDDARDALRGDWFFGELEGDAPVPDPNEMIEFGDPNSPSGPT